MHIISIALLLSVSYLVPFWAIQRRIMACPWNLVFKVFKNGNIQ